MVTVPRKWNFWAFYKIFVYMGLCFIWLEMVPNSIWDPEVRHITYTIGVLGAWRYTWWMTHFIRALIYEHVRYPALQKAGRQIWSEGYRPPHIHFMMVTFYEERDITHAVLDAICRELITVGVPGTIWLGTGASFDERIARDFLTRNYPNLDLRLTTVRQNVPGKRAAMGLCLRAMNRHRVGDDDLILFMDGDFIFEKGLLSKTAPLFVADPELQALTTNEQVALKGPKWMETWLIMRFGQRDMVMRSHALSNRVLTLTGRCSMFRAKYLKDLKFIRTLESDHLRHWLWGDFRFLSGDDKSTWFHLLSKRAKMIYALDANGYTVEVLHGSAWDRMVQNLRRWSGNMLRNGERALRLGPTRMPFFIWWCLVDQRISMWTMLISPLLAFQASVLNSSSYLLTYVVFLAITRFLQSAVLWKYVDKVYISFPGFLYINQLVGAGVKVYVIFRLSKQRWANRGNQTAGESAGIVGKIKNLTAQYLTTLYMTLLMLIVLKIGGLVTFPSWDITWAVLTQPAAF